MCRADLARTPEPALRAGSCGGGAGGLVRPVPARTAVRVQHDDATALVDGPAQRLAAGIGAGLSAAGVAVEAGRVDRTLVVVVGLGRSAGVSVPDDGARARSHY